MANKDIIFLGGVDWFNKYKLPRHHTAKILSRTNRIFYIDNFGGGRDLTFKDTQRALKKLKFAVLHKIRNSENIENKQKKIVVYQPIIIPTARLQMTVGKVNNILMQWQLKRLINKYQIKNPIIWNNVTTQVVWDSVKKLDYKLLIYQSVDKFSNSPMIPTSLRPQFSKLERMFCQLADLVFVSARGLFEEKRRINKRTYFFPNGVEQEKFGRKNRAINFFNKIKGPVIGFAGVLGPWIDYKLLFETAKNKPEWSFVFLGPINHNVNLHNLDKLANVYFVGTIEHSRLSDWFKYFNVGLIPYLINEFTKYTFPSKMAEYIAEELPVISTALPEIEPYSNVVKMINNSREMITAIQQVLDNPKKEHFRSECRRIATMLSWETIVSKMEKLIDEAFNGFE